MEFGLLGSLQVRGTLGGISPRPSRQSVLLVTLLSRANSPVSIGELVEAAWGEHPPAAENAAVHTTISRLRQMLSVSVDPAGYDRIVTDTMGYSIRVLDGELDASVFRGLVAEGRAALDGGRGAEAVVTLERALDLWRGSTAASGMSGWFVESLRGPLDDLRLSATEDLARARLMIGQADAVAEELRGLVTRHPFRERLWEHLMLALYRTGRQSDALDTFREARRTLIDQLGIEPGPELCGLYRRILDNDPALLDVATTDPGAVVVTRAEPRQLPADVVNFVGREQELQRLDALTAGRDAADGGGPMVFVVDGGAGIGKTALAVRWAHRARGRFDGGDLYVNLHGFDATGSPTDPFEALDQLLRALHITPSEIPRGLEERAALYRTVLSDRRLIVVLDNAADAEQVRPLLPGSSSCAVIVTSRKRLSGLVAREGAVRLTVGSLGSDDAAALIRRISGPGRSDVSGEALDTLIGLCCRIPLALRVAAERLTLRQHGTLADLVDEIGSRQSALSTLTLPEDATSSVRTVFSWSYSMLGPASRRMFRLLGLFPGEHTSVPAAAALAGVSVADALDLLESLVSMHLLEEVADRRYRLHDLLRDYARERAELEAEDTGPDRALTRLAGWYLCTARNATVVILPPSRPRRAVPVQQEPGIEPVTFGSYRQALDWFEAERVTLIAVADYCVRHEVHDLASQLPAALWGFFQVRGYTGDWITTHERALASARAMGLAVEAPALCNLGTAYLEAYQFDRAVEYHQRALVLGNELGDAWVVGVSTANLGEGYRRAGRYELARTHFEQAVSLGEANGNNWLYAFSLGSLATVLSALGEHDEATGMYDRALVIHREHGDHYQEARCLQGLGDAYRSSAKHRDAKDSYLRALALCREMGNGLDTARITYSLGEIELELGQHAEAEAHFKAADEIAGQLEDSHRALLRAQFQEHRDQRDSQG
ncbi:tetratricopeptide repeat protein [Amycolatopsis sp. NBC_00345]|uniref:AfsR/SARP family transcriptional regulator n=1 Tax=Amycolatopsis sp. NBC_00345 TaxID=2975955 RepID=UPI002E267D5F